MDGEVTGFVIDRPMATRDALEPLLKATDAVVVERDGRVAVVGQEATVQTLAGEDLALPETAEAMTRDRRLEERPATARVRYADAAADHQTASVVMRADQAAGGGSVDIDLPLACSAEQAQRVAAVALAAGGEAESRTVRLGPTAALTLEGGDLVRFPDAEGVWRVESLALEETPRATVRRRVTPVAALLGAPEVPIPETPVLSGAPFAVVLELPATPGEEDDARPRAAVAVEPWRAMTVHAGADASALRPRAEARRPATVGRLIQALGPGVVGRWDRVNGLEVQLEGRAPQSRSRAAVLSGENRVLVETEAGWEVVGFLEAVPMGGDRWRLSGLLRALGGTDVEMRTGAEIGATVILADDALVRLDIGRHERGLPLMVRVAPTGAPPGGSWVRTLETTIRGVHDRPWTPAHLRVATGAPDWILSWIPRRRVHGDAWDESGWDETVGRFRVRFLDGAIERRAVDVEDDRLTYTAAQRAADFPAGLATAWVEVSQWGAGWGWGPPVGMPLAG